MQQVIPFDTVSEEDRIGFLRDTWCDVCQRADRGITEPMVVRENGRDFLVGRCIACGNECTTEVVMREIRIEVPD